MSSIVEIERAIKQLSPEELEAFRAWFVQRDAAEWDRQFEEDAAGRLNAMPDQATRDMQERQCGDFEAPRNA